MTSQQRPPRLSDGTIYQMWVFSKALKKAVDNGLTGYWADRYKMCLELDEMEFLVNGNNVEDGKPLEALLFDHDFAKALWGDWIQKKNVYSVDDALKNNHDGLLPKYKFHLQQMVIAEDPIKYLGENI